MSIDRSRPDPATRVHRLRNPVRDYAWGSRTVIPDLLGMAPTDSPAAELWLGAHPAAPSVLLDDPDSRTLIDAIAADPERMLGRRTTQRFGTLPFLLKVLAVDHPLSMQAHPTRAQAREGYADEDARGIPADSPDRNYKDANHKPEQVCALTEFEGLCGFRPIGRTVEFLRALNVPEIYPVRLLAEGGLRDIVTGLLTIPAGHVRDHLDGLLPNARALADRDVEWSPEARWITRLAEEYPGDRGVLLALYLNLVTLAPGESMFLPAGELHAYLRGAAVEIMANSDNVLRGGLTGKHIDVVELLRVLDLSEQPDPIVRPTKRAAGEFDYPSRVADFALVRLSLEAALTRSAGAPQIMLCTSGSALLTTEAGEDVPLLRGESVFVPAAVAVTVTPVAADTTVFVATTNLDR